MIELIGLDRVRARINGILPVARGNFGTAPVQAGQVLRKQTQEIFTTAGYGAWPKSVREGKTGQPTLQDTNALMYALVNGGDMTARSRYYLLPRGHGDGLTPNKAGEIHTAAAIFKATTRSLDYGVKSAYAHLLNNPRGFVSVRYNRWVAGRPFLTITVKSAQEILNSWLGWAGLSFARPRP